MNRIEGLRLIAGFVLGPAIGVLVLLLGLFLKSAVAPVGDENVPFLAVFGMGAAYLAYSVTFIIGLPLFIVFRIKGWLRPWQFAGGGLLVGALIALIPGVGIAFGLMFCTVGLATGVAFWLIAIFRNRALTPGSSTDAPTAARG